MSSFISACVRSLCCCISTEKRERPAPSPTDQKIVDLSPVSTIQTPTLQTPTLSPEPSTTRSSLTHDGAKHLVVIVDQGQEEVFPEGRFDKVKEHSPRERDLLAKAQERRRSRNSDSIARAALAISTPEPVSFRPSDDESGL